MSLKTSFLENIFSLYFLHNKTKKKKSIFGLIGKFSFCFNYFYQNKKRNSSNPFLLLLFNILLKKGPSFPLFHEFQKQHICFPFAKQFVFGFMKRKFQLKLFLHHLSHGQTKPYILHDTQPPSG